MVNTFSSYITARLDEARSSRRALWVFDFDDTLAHAGSAVGVLRGGVRVRDLSSLTFKDYHLQSGEEFDFSGADRVVDPKPIGAVLKVMRAVLAQGKTTVILTGRTRPEPVEEWLASVGIRVPVVAIGHAGASHASIAKAKRDWLERAIADGYNDIEFWDDNAVNIRVADTLKREYPHVRLRTRLVKYTARGLREGTEHGDAPQPQPEYFKKPFSISGKIVQLYPVWDVPVKTASYHNKLGRAALRAWERTGRAVRPNEMSPEQQRVVDANSVWRWRVRVQTDEGWMLMGFIGSTKRKEDLPPIRAGDTVELTGLKLSARTGGHRRIGRTWGGQAVDAASETALDYRSHRFDRQLHGKVKRKSV